MKAVIEKRKICIARRNIIHFKVTCSHYYRMGNALNFHANYSLSSAFPLARQKCSPAFIPLNLLLSRWREILKFCRAASAWLFSAQVALALSLELLSQLNINEVKLLRFIDWSFSRTYTSHSEDRSPLFGNAATQRGNVASDG